MGSPARFDARLTQRKAQRGNFEEVTKPWTQMQEGEGNPIWLFDPKQVNIRGCENGAHKQGEW